MYYVFPKNPTKSCLISSSVIGVETSWHARPSFHHVSGNIQKLITMPQHTYKFKVARKIKLLYRDSISPTTMSHRMTTLKRIILSCAFYKSINAANNSSFSLEPSLKIWTTHPLPFLYLDCSSPTRHLLILLIKSITILLKKLANYARKTWSQWFLQ